MTIKDKVLSGIIKIAVVVFVVCSTIQLGDSFAVAQKKKPAKKTIQSYAMELSEQEVGLHLMENVNIDEIEFKDTEYKTKNEVIKESEKYFKLPIYAKSYSNPNKIKGYVVVEKDGFEEFFTVNENMYHYSLGHYKALLITENQPYYKNAASFATISGFTSKRLDNVMLGDYLFECYQDSPNHLTFVCDLGQGCYIKYETYVSGEQIGEFNESFKIKHMNVQVETEEKA